MTPPPLQSGHLSGTPHGSTSIGGPSVGKVYSSSSSSPKISQAEREKRAAEEFGDAYRRALEIVIVPTTPSFPLKQRSLEDYQEFGSQDKENLERHVRDLVAAAAELRIPVAVRESLIKGLYAQFFYQSMGRMEGKIKRIMMESAVDPDGIFTFDRNGLQLHFDGHTVDLDFLEEYALKAGLSAQDLAKEVKRVDHQFKKVNAFMVTGDLLRGQLNYYSYLVPCVAIVEDSPFECRSWKETIDPEQWKEDFLAPLQRSASRFFYIY